MKVCEIFDAIQGEGPEAGTPTTFLRLSGCNLKCNFCDSKYHNEGREMSIEEIVSVLLPKQHITITGGEPVLQENECGKLMSVLRNKYFSLETNGTHLTYLGYGSVVVSPKHQKIVPSILSHYNSSPHTSFKFVYESKKDVWWEELIQEEGLHHNKIFIMPEGKTREEQLGKMPEVMEYCLERGYRFSPRLHVLAFGNRRGV